MHVVNNDTHHWILHSQTLVPPALSASTAPGHAHGEGEADGRVLIQNTNFGTARIFCFPARGTQPTSLTLFCAETMGQSLSLGTSNNKAARDDLNSSDLGAGKEDMPLEDVRDSKESAPASSSAKPNDIGLAHRGDSSSRPMSEAPVSSSALSTDEGFLTPMSITQKHDQAGAESYNSLQTPTPLPSVMPLGPTSISTSDRMAEITDRVNKILAPVHALSSLNQTQSQVNLNPQPQVLHPDIKMERQTGIITPTTPTIVTRNGGRRGRGIRRRGGSPLNSDTITVISTTQSDFATPPTSRGRGSRGSGRPRGSRAGRGGGRGGKRKRSDEGGNSDTESSENFTPLAQSRSGRKIVQSSNVIKIEDDTPTVSPSSRPGKVTPTANKVATVRGSGRKRGNSKRTPGGPGAVCKNCGRSPSLPGNEIVFCDGCNTPWHKYCHDPPIPNEVILTAEKEWFCSDCVVLKEEKSRLRGKVSGQQMSLLEV